MGKSKFIHPHAELARGHRTYKSFCQRCGASNPLKATRCRKCKRTGCLRKRGADWGGN